MEPPVYVYHVQPHKQRAAPRKASAPAAAATLVATPAAPPAAAKPPAKRRRVGAAGLSAAQVTGEGLWVYRGAQHACDACSQ
jgi:hypothetical protein